MNPIFFFRTVKISVYGIKSGCDLVISLYLPQPHWSTSPADELSAGCAGLWGLGRKLKQHWPTCWTDVWWPGQTSKRLPSLSYPSETTASQGSGMGPDGQTAPEMWQHIHWLYPCGWHLSVVAGLTISTIYCICILNNHVAGFNCLYLN